MIRPSLSLAVALLAASACERPTVIPYDETACAPVRARQVSDAGFLPYGHSHNDYEQAQPLIDALDLKFYSVEADVWFRTGNVVVSHDSYSAKGTLKDLYLDPLQARVDALGSVHGDGVQFVLWLDLKDGSLGLRQNLGTLLATYPMLSVFTDDAEVQNPVLAVITGNDASKKVFVDESSPRYAVRDSNDYSPSDRGADNRWRYYALDWNKWIAWNGEEDFPDGERKRLSCLVADIHGKGKKLRFWASPSTPAFYDALVEVGVDFLGSDHLTSMAAYLEALPP